MSKPFWRQIIWHWSATGRTWCEPGHYHAVVTAESATSPATLHRLTDYNTPLYEATAYRNSTTISLAVAAMSPEGGTWASPPTENQLDTLCKETARLCLEAGWAPEHLQDRCMTHAEAGGLRDYPIHLVEQFSHGTDASSVNYDHAAQAAGLPHANYGPSSWPDGWPGGDVCRWDLWQLRESDVGGAGGHELRLRTMAWMKKLKATPATH